MNLPIIVIGSGGHAKVVIDVLKLCGANIFGATDAEPTKHGQTILGVKILGGDDVISKHGNHAVYLANGIGSTADTSLRQRVFERFKNDGFMFITIIHPTAIVARDIIIGEGSQIMAGVVIQTGTKIGVNCIINTRSSIDHDCIVSDHVHIAPGAILSGGVNVDSGVHIGTGAAIIHNVKIGQQSIIGAGATIVRPVKARTTIIDGLPTKP